MPTITRLRDLKRDPISEQFRRERERGYERIDQRRRERQVIYQNPRWRLLREAKLNQCPICECCHKNGVIMPATQVHHKISFMSADGYERESLAFDITNLLSVCEDCHQEIHANNMTNSGEMLKGLEFWSRRKDYKRKSPEY